MVREYILWYGVELLLSSISLLLVYLFSVKMLTVRGKYNSDHIILISAIFSVVLFIIKIMLPNAFFGLVLNAIVLYTYLEILFEEETKEKFIMLATYVIFYGVANSVSIAVFILLHEINIDSIYLSSNIARFEVSVTTKIILMFIIFMWTTYYKKESIIYIPKEQSRRFIVMFAFLMVGIIIILHMLVQFAVNLYNSFIIVCITFLLFGCYIFIYNQFNSMAWFYHEKNELDIMYDRDKLIEKHTIKKQETDDEIKVLLHDLKHNMVYWKKLVNNNELLALEEELSRYENSINENMLIDVNNDIANAIINEQVVYAKNRDIKIKCSGIFQENINIQARDLVSVLGNALENAVEATSKVIDRNNRIIRIRIKNDEQYVFIEITNNYEIEPIIKNNELISTKQNEAISGIGIKSIKKTAEQYEGNASYIIKNKQFKLIIMMLAYDTL